ncbi:MAG: ATP-binding cassette domain-containing protein, partial [Lachnospiraceae bacterium]|nr:ATP-binding cassette domain-containing protein [Lachnospiraceae bacterium]
MIEIKGVTKRFDEITALQNVSASVEEGQVFGLIGTNGSGKSTLLRCVCGIYRPEEGEVLIDGESVYDNPSAKS